MTTLARDAVMKTRTGTPESVAMYARDVVGPTAVALAAKECLAGENVRFAACERDNNGGPPEIKQVYEWAVVPGKKCVRYCVEGNPLKGGTHTLCGSLDERGDPATMDVAEVAACMVYALMCSGSWVFRLK